MRAFQPSRPGLPSAPHGPLLGSDLVLLRWDAVLLGSYSLGERDLGRGTGENEHNLQHSGMTTLDPGPGRNCHFNKGLIAQRTPQGWEWSEESRGTWARGRAGKTV